MHRQQDTQSRDDEFHHLRDTDGRKPVLFVECKLGDDALDKSLRYLSARFPGVDAWQVSLEGKKDHVTPEGIRVAPAIELLRTLV
ncbi:MAG: hypothetical protein HZB39_08730 [Planctomycetes bacterium]|nr:hypothetical protein [Planctomycetota bacterium]